jgi:tetratricopeptide (TPR) repeat protein
LNKTKAIFLFGQLLIEMGEYEKANNYFQLLLERTPNDHLLDIATIHSYLGRIARNGRLFNEALSHHYIALKVRSFIS